MVKSRKRKPRRKSKSRNLSLKCKYGILKRPVRDKQTGRMRYCKKAPRKSRRKCKHGILKRPVRDKQTGRMRYCKKAPRKSRRKSTRKKAPRKSRRKSTRKKGISCCMQQDKKIFQDDVEVNIDFKNNTIEALKGGKILESYKYVKDIFKNKRTTVSLYKDTKDQEIVLKQESDNTRSKEADISNKLKGNNCNIIRLKDGGSVKEYNEDGHQIGWISYYIMDKFTGDLTELSLDKKNIIPIMKSISKQLICLYTEFKPPLWYTDIKLANVFYCDTYDTLSHHNTMTLHLGDLGSMYKDEDGEYIATFPPLEVADNGGYFNIKSVDSGKKILSWGVGIMILIALFSYDELFFFHYSLVNSFSSSKLQKIIDNSLEEINTKKLLYPEDIDKLRNLLYVDPKNRKTLEEVFFDTP